MKIRDNVKKIPPYVPGKSKEEIARKYGLKLSEIIKLASNENPLGAPKKAVAQILKFASQVSAYPDAEASELREEISRYIGIKKECIIAGNGSDEILELAVKLFLNEGEEAIIPVPTFSLYENLVRLYSGKPVFVPLDENFQFDCEKIMKKISEKTKLVFISSPNNPTGNVIFERDLRRILRNNVAVILDEAYVEFADVSHVKLVNEFENLIVLRTFSKAFGLAGARVGYGVADEKIIEYMFRIKLPFNANLLSQKAAIGALRDKEHLRRSIRTVKEGREFLTKELSKIDGIVVYQSKANFLLINLEGMGKKARRIAEDLYKGGIITRECSSFKLNEYYLRVSIGTALENRKFLTKFRDIVKRSGTRRNACPLAIASEA